MASGAPDILLDGPAVDRAEVHFREHHDRILRGTDRLFARLLAAEWLVGIAVAVVISPLAWAGIPGAAPSHLWTAVLLGGGIVALPIALALTRPGEPVTRHGVAVGQMLFAGLLVHLTGGRTETHFFVFGSLAVLAFYRDWRVLVTATGIVVLDHLLRGLLWPESVYGAESASPWRTAEHAWWLTFEDMFLIAACLQGNREMRGIAGHRARLESAEHVASVLEATPRQEVEAEMRKARDAAEAATRTKSEFLANMSHEIRTPMNGVLGMTGLLMGTELTADQREYVQMLRGSGEALLTLVNDILDFSKIEAGRLEVEEIDFDLHSVVQEAVNLLAERAHHKSLELAYLIHSEVPGAVCGDPGRLRQILLNLVGNAIKFTPSGEVILRARLATEDEDSRTIRFEVTDTGIGIDAEARARLFEPFTQAEGSTTRKFGGTGLGLAISRQLTELMGGRIGVESEAGKGSTFWFTVRLRKQAGDAVPLPQPLESLRDLRLLVVDDNTTNRRIVMEQARSWGMLPEEAPGGREALDILVAAADRGKRHDLAIVDMQMPEMDGLQLARAIQADRRLAGMRLIMLTSIGMRGHAAESRRAGYSGYLTKPAGQSQLYDCIATVMAGEQAEAGIDASAGFGAGGSPERPLVTRHSLKEMKGQGKKRILVVDDNETNQLVAVQILLRLGYHAEVAANGAEAVEAFRTLPFDLILMDCQMPHMDGYDATRTIREAEKATGQHMPIIAVTANAMKGDREKCLAAGMDDYLRKPVKMEELRVTLERWLPPTPAENAVPPAAHRARATSSSKKKGKPMEALDPEVFGQLKQADGGTGGFLIALIDKFLEEAPKRLAGLSEAVDRSDKEGLVKAAHSLKGSCATLGAQEMSRMCAGMEECGKAGRMTETGLRLASIQEEFARVRKALDAERRRVEAGRRTA